MPILKKINKIDGKSLIIIYILILIGEYLYLLYRRRQMKLPTDEITTELNFNRKYKKELYKLFTNKLDDALAVINQQGMTVEKWSKYMRENAKFSYKGRTFYVFSWRKTENNTGGQTFINISHGIESNQGKTRTAINQNMETNMMFNKYTVNDELASIMFNDPRTKLAEYPSVKYYYIDPLTGNAIEKESIYTTWRSHSGIEGYMGVGYTIGDLASKNDQLYVDSISIPKIIFAHLVCLILTYIILTTGKKIDPINAHKALMFMGMITIFLVNFLSTKENPNSYTIENEKMDRIVKGLMSLAFLTSVCIYVITKLRNTRRDLYFENSCVFAVAVVMMLISQYTSVNYKNLGELIEQRISKQLFFNYAVLLNIFMIVNFIIFYLTDMVKKNTR
jgi:hypothetical protein